MELKFDRFVVCGLIAACLFLFARQWLAAHPEHDPWAPLELDDPAGWATERKLASLRSDFGECRAFLARAEAETQALPAAGQGSCRRNDRSVIDLPEQSGAVLRPSGAQSTCAVQAALAWWVVHGVQPAAERLLGAPVARIEHLGTNSCRRIGGGDTGNWSEHATGNAVDVAAFVLADGRRISVASDWAGEAEAALFLREVRDAACTSFATVLSPQYNRAHADHFHLDQAVRASGWSTCR
jgi:hypothetical protein